jgi:hypothetical protein
MTDPRVAECLRLLGRPPADPGSVRPLATPVAGERWLRPMWLNAAVEAMPTRLVHGDCHAGNLLAQGRGLVSRSGRGGGGSAWWSAWCGSGGGW